MTAEDAWVRNSVPGTWAGGDAELCLNPMIVGGRSRIGEESWDEEGEESLGGLPEFADTVLMYLPENVGTTLPDAGFDDSYYTFS